MPYNTQEEVLFVIDNILKISSLSGDVFLKACVVWLSPWRLNGLMCQEFRDSLYMRGEDGEEDDEFSAQNVEAIKGASYALSQHSCQHLPQRGSRRPYPSAYMTFAARVRCRERDVVSLM